MATVLTGRSAMCEGSRPTYKIPDEHKEAITAETTNELGRGSYFIGLYLASVPKQDRLRKHRLVATVSLTSRWS
ncbi:hypothetical protein F4561_002091 [Lipingzhangella halophila]|uniref:Uncharacterized protein n=1 Tax=Lipingzhangella halophila TaxID=1783352 RepID=A0A7W7RH00_9ACTN|nr:hypothetical protein [Lipingzhangella halophila]